MEGESEMQAVEDAYRAALSGVAPDLLGKTTDRAFRQLVEDLLRLMDRQPQRSLGRPNHGRCAIFETGYPPSHGCTHLVCRAQLRSVSTAQALHPRPAFVVDSVKHRSGVRGRDESKPACAGPWRSAGVFFRRSTAASEKVGRSLPIARQSMRHAGAA